MKPSRSIETDETDHMDKPPGIGARIVWIANEGVTDRARISETRDAREVL